MAIREDLVASAVTFLQDPNVCSSPLENRIAFLQSKNLTQEEVDAAIARAGRETTPSSYSNYAYPQQVARPPQNGYDGYQQYPWQQPAPPELPKRDWRDWFIMATVMGGVSYGAYVLAKRYIYPIIAPPTTPQLEQDKQAIDESFEKAFSLLDQLAKDTETLKSAEQARTERLDTALTEVEAVISELKSVSRRREEESRRIGDEVRGLKDLIPKAIEGQKETTDKRLQELNTELKSLKTLMGQRMTPGPSVTSSVGRSNIGNNLPVTSLASNTNGTTINESTTLRPASVSNVSRTDPVTVASLQAKSINPFNTGAPAGKATIPSWQLASKGTNSLGILGSGSGTPDASSST